jgi:hypothetical protein
MNSNNNNNGKLRGAIHVHTNLSHDGTLSLGQLVEFFKQHGYDFIAITEHSYDINQQSIDVLAKECERISSPELFIIPGIEFRCHDNIDILGYGVTQTCDSIDPATIIKHIQDCGGVAVFAHPTVRNYPIDKDWVQLLDGAEIWNRQEGKYLPQIVTMKRFLKFKRWHPKILAFCGLDFHRKSSYFPFTTIVASQNNGRDSILTALKNGNFKAENPFFNLGSNGDINYIKRIFVYTCSALLNVIRDTREVFGS